MTNELTELINIAKDEVNKHPNGELILPLRKSIYKLLGEHKDDEEGHAILTQGLLRRTELAIFCVNKVMPIWNNVLASDTTPSTILENIKEYIVGRLTWDYLWEIPNSYWTVLDNYIIENNNYDNALYVGYASINALYVVLNDEDFDEDNEDLLDQDLDPYTWDTAFYSSLAYSESEQYNEETKIRKRREFWLWYLDEAIPKAMQFSRTKN